MSFCSDVLKDYNRTLKYLNLALKLEPKNSELNSLIGLTHDSLNNSEEAQKYYTIAYELDNTNLLSS
jgi:tetratricopeptide (TPR) repeat protein